MSAGKTRVWQRKKRDHMIANDRTIDVWLCLACGLAYPSDSRDLDWHTTVVFHRECLISQNRNQGQMKHVGMMSSHAASVLCGPRFNRIAAPPKQEPARLSASIAERVKEPPRLAVVPTPAETCVSCGDTLVDGECPSNTPGWPHVVS